MTPTDRLEELSAILAVPSTFWLYTHEMPSGYQIVEPKDIPPGTAIVTGPVRTFLHNALIEHSREHGGRIAAVRGVRIFRPSTGFTTVDYSTFEIFTRCSFNDMLALDFKPEPVNLIGGSVVFTRKYYEQVESDLDLVLSEDPLWGIMPLG
jgi:hypothetical protein